MKTISSIGIILDGNRRWAKAHAVPSIEGHRKGVSVLEELFNEFPRLKREYGLESVVLYAFSTENWNRSQEELGFLMGLFESVLSNLVKSLKKENNSEKKLRIKIIGERKRFSPKLQEIIHSLEEETAKNTAGQAYIALSYGGRSEIMSVVNNLLQEGAREVTEEGFSKRLWTGDMPDPDIIIRTGGAQRLSNFLPWQSVYSELFFTDTLWPDFTVKELEEIFKEFQSRERRHGK